MTRTLTWACAALLIAALARAQPPDTIDTALERVKAIGEPAFDPARKGEPGYLEQYRAEQHELYRKKAAVLLEACRHHPGDPRVPELMSKRWVLLGWNQDPRAVAAEVLADIDAVLKPDADAAVARDAAYWRAYYHGHIRDAAGGLSAAEGFAKAHPEDERGAELLAAAAEREGCAREAAIGVYRALAERYPKTHAGTFAPGMARRLESLGKPLELAFKDAISGRQVDLADLRGKVVVIDFWSTTCGPCLAEMPKMVELYQAHRARGVEFIGVSLDESEERPPGVLAALKRTVARQKMEWPQYYQGQGFESSFSKSWGVGSIPAVFVVDKAGKLRSVDARGKLETLLPELLAE